MLVPLSDALQTAFLILNRLPPAYHAFVHCYYFCKRFAWATKTCTRLPVCGYAGGDDPQLPASQHT